MQALRFIASTNMFVGQDENNQFIFVPREIFAIQYQKEVERIIDAAPSEAKAVDVPQYNAFLKIVWAQADAVVYSPAFWKDKDLSH